MSALLAALERCARGARLGAASASLRTQARRISRANVKDYGVGDGPMANLLRVIRDAGDARLTSKQIYERAVDANAGVRSRRHAKGLLNWMKKIDRVQTWGPEGGKGKSWVFSLTARGEKHVAKIEAAAARESGGLSGAEGTAEQPKRERGIE